MKRPLTLAVFGAAAALLAAGCSSGGGGSSASGGTPQQGGSVTFAMPPNATPNWIFPIGTPGHLASFNGAIRQEVFLPLYAYDGYSGTVAMDEKASAAKAPVYSNGGKTVDIKLNTLTWANGQKVTSRDVEFWFNLVKANKSQWGNYSAGDIPDNVAKFETVSDTEFKLHLTKAYNPDWFTANQLTYVTPIPQSAWDVESSGGKVGDYDRTTDGAKKVFKYLTGEAGKLSEYASNPLWKVANGPFTVKEFTTTGQVTLAKNPKYTGPDTAHLDTVTFKPFTSADAELNVLRSGGVDYGYMPALATSQQKSIENLGYQVKPWNGWAVTYIPYNFNNPAMSAVFKQLYIRQAVQMSIDQTTISRVIWHNQAAPGYGPVPQTPVSKYLAPEQRTNPYPFDLNKAKALLTSHGWTIQNGVAACTQAGSGANQCGDGVKAGTQLKLTIDSQSGSTETDNMMQEVQSSLSKIGIKLSIKSEPLNSVLDHTAQCKPSQPSCSWQLSFFGTAGSWYFPAYPSGEQIFSSTGSSNLGSYVDPTADDLIKKSTSSSDPAAMQKYDAYVTKNLPVIWMPNPAYQVSAIKNNLRGVVQDPLVFMQPQRWYLAK
ncbi:peptide ABC transporter substrate-binding protein [Actinoallomurus iriomotensis]|uniref:Peptide ABC transporter substrate-binding protein n=1 Tax=Actinoallomurus iriomotensis TaxID=478107 RepID=A0A9W6RJ97_9ACTN|nr:peptide ABC transporter substrate-binding protein [Actinoallomurus iriomotensis]GLY77026.1 peptide ABC transporter substrate-binding protein [Actinoallomurus iriomotensis]